MKKNIFQYNTLLLFTLMLLSACKYDTTVPNAGDYVKIYMPQAVEAPAVRTFTMTDTAQNIIFGAAYGGTGYPGQNIEVKFKADIGLVERFNRENSTNYTPIPAGSFELEKTSAIIRKGDLKTEPLKIKIRTKGILEPFKQYLLPISIEQVSEEKVNEDLRTAFFLIEGQQQGVNLKIMSYGIKSGTVDMNTVAEIVNAHAPDLLVIREIDSATTRSSGRDLPKVLSELIGMPNYVFATAQAYQGGKYGLVVYSKLPAETRLSRQLYANVTEQGPLGILTIDINDKQKVVFAGTHLNANVQRRNLQVTELLNIMKDYTTDPVILAGNFNDKAATGEAYISFASQFTFPCTACIPNYPKTAPASNSDMMMYKPANSFRTLSHTVAAISTSDHLPVITQLQIFY